MMRSRFFQDLAQDLAQDHAGFGLIQSKTLKVIDLKKSEGYASRKPVAPFPRTARRRSAKRPDLVFAVLIVFVILLIGLVRAIDLLAAVSTIG